MKIKEFILDTLFPPLCFGCQKYHKNYLCENCFSQIKINNSFFCPVCQNRLPMGASCHPDADYLLAPATDYSNLIVQKLIQDLKYEFLTSTMIPIGGIINIYLGNLGIKELSNFTIIPIPLFKKRFRQRGFNQAELIAEHIANILNLKSEILNLVRIKDSPKQSEAKNWDNRQKNIIDCFALKNSEIIKNKNIILVDDVFTSGATINEAVKVLKAADCRKIIALTIARAR